MLIMNLAIEVECHVLVHDLRSAYQALRKVNSKPSCTGDCYPLSGHIISDQVGVQKCWAEYLEHLYQVDPPIVNMDAGSVEISVLDPPINGDPPSLAEEW